MLSAQHFHRIVGWHGGICAALQSYGLDSIPRAVIFCFSIYFVFTIKFALYFLLFLTFYCIMPLIQLNAFFNHG